MSAKMKTDKSTLARKSAAEFFAEHQQIAGFDNPAKSLFTTVREFVENSLDAAESADILPDISVTIVEFLEDEHNAKHGIHKAAKPGLEENSAAGGSGVKPSKADKGKPKDAKYYLVTCKDNGCGMAPTNIGDSFGRVLSGSKHGIRQTRGKYGLGAKMALIWSKKSSGLPINIKTAQYRPGSSSSSSSSHVTSVVLDIDIYKNEPRVLSSKSTPNSTGWHGLEICLTILGNWSNCRAKMLQYFQQLAVITPYASFELEFQCEREPKKNFRLAFSRRSDQVPPPARETLPHPKGLNNITLSNLLSTTSAPTMIKVLTSELSGISGPTATKVLSSLNLVDVSPSAVSGSKVAALLQVLRDDSSIREPSSRCLSPAGEYNMRLGVLKELKPRIVATYSDKAGSHEGHPFIVEAAVSVGGQNTKEGINVFRFANRIPLLFETGADVVTQVANKRIRWTNYHIDPKKDSIGVFVSIVSTRIPFKGTSKEYIGDDVTEIQLSVRRALQGCCQQLRASLAHSISVREEAERRKLMIKYIPDISRSLFTVLKKIDAAAAANAAGGKSREDQSASAHAAALSLARNQIMASVSSAVLSQQHISDRLHKAVERLNQDMAKPVLDVLEQAEGDKSSGENAVSLMPKVSMKRTSLFFVPIDSNYPDPNDGPDSKRAKLGAEGGAGDLTNRWLHVKSSNGIVGLKILLHSKSA